MGHGRGHGSGRRGQRAAAARPRGQGHFSRPGPAVAGRRALLRQRRPVPHHQVPADLPGGAFPHFPADDHRPEPAQSAQRLDLPRYDRPPTGRFRRPAARRTAPGGGRIQARHNRRAAHVVHGAPGERTRHTVYRRHPQLGPDGVPLRRTDAALRGLLRAGRELHLVPLPCGERRDQKALRGSSQEDHTDPQRLRRGCFQAQAVQPEDSFRGSRHKGGPGTAGHLFRGKDVPDQRTGHAGGRQPAYTGG